MTCCRTGSSRPTSWSEGRLDTVEGLGSFVEFEFKSDVESEAEAIARLHEFIDALGVPLGERSYGYPHMLLDCLP